LLTNDGKLTNLLTHPKNRVEKEYLVELDQPLGKANRLRLIRGIYDSGELLKARTVSEVMDLEVTASERYRWILITLQEGKNREIRRMMGSMHKKIQTLRRVRIGALNLGTLKLGEYRTLESKEVANLYNSAKGLSKNTYE
jgi:pseudouridine synthase